MYLCRFAWKDNRYLFNEHSWMRIEGFLPKISNLVSIFHMLHILNDYRFSNFSINGNAKLFQQILLLFRYLNIPKGTECCLSSLAEWFFESWINKLIIFTEVQRRCWRKFSFHIDGCSIANLESLSLNVCDGEVAFGRLLPNLPELYLITVSPMI